MRFFPLARLLVVSCLLLEGHARADVGLLSEGDVSVAASGVYEPFNRLWYYRGDDTLVPYDWPDNTNEYNTRFSASSYSPIPLNCANDTPGSCAEGAEPTVHLMNAGLRVEFGLSDELTLQGRTQFVSGRQDDGTAGQTSGVGDTYLGLKYGVVKEGPVMVTLAAGATLPGSYEKGQLWSPGDGQGGFEGRLMLGGLAMKRKLVYDVGLGYRARMPYRDIKVLDYTVAACETQPCTEPDYHLQVVADGPTNETFADAVVGYFVNRKVLAFANLDGVDAHGGLSWDDYVAAQQGQLCSGQGTGDITCSEPVGAQASVLYTELEEDYLRAGVGVLVKPQPSWTVFVNYSYTVLGKNTAAFLSYNGLPIGTVAAGVEFTFGAKAAQAQASRSLSPDQVLAMDLSAPQAPTSSW